MVWASCVPLMHTGLWYVLFSFTAALAQATAYSAALARALLGRAKERSVRAQVLARRA